MSYDSEYEKMKSTIRRLLQEVAEKKCSVDLALKLILSEIDDFISG